MACVIAIRRSPFDSTLPPWEDLAKGSSSGLLIHRPSADLLADYEGFVAARSDATLPDAPSVVREGAFAIADMLGAVVSTLAAGSPVSVTLSSRLLMG